jgi:hypothetical protein
VSKGLTATHILLHKTISNQGPQQNTKIATQRIQIMNSLYALKIKKRLISSKLKQF